MRLGYENISEDVEFRDFLRAQLTEPELTLERLPMDTMTKVYRLHLPGRAPLFCKRGVINPQMVKFLLSLPEDPILIPILRKVFPDFKGDAVLVFEWCDLRHVHFGEMSDSQFEAFVDGSQRLYDILKDASIAQEPFDADKWMETVRENCRKKPFMNLAFRSILGMRPADYRYPAEMTGVTVTHGDFHAENFGFDEGGQLKFLDFDLMVRALPTEDYTLFVGGALRHVRMLFSPMRRRRIIRRYERLITRLPYLPEEWRIALNRARLRHAAERIVIKGASLSAAYDFARRDLLWRHMYGALQELSQVRLVQEALERAFGFSLSELRPIKSVNALNYKAVRRRDGLTFLVKIMLKDRDAECALIGTHLAEMKGMRVPHRIFEQECREKIMGRQVICLEWCEGRSMFPDELTEGEFQTLLTDYLEFSEALQRTTLTDGGYTPKVWRDCAIANCRGFCGRILRQLIEETPENECCFRPERVRVIHGDLHPGNFVFRDGRVRAFFDLGGFAWGYPALDFIRYFGFSVEHLSVFRFVRRRRLFRRFAQAVRELPYPADEWIAAINATWMERIDKKLDERPVTASALLHLLASARLYRKLRRIVRRENGSAEE